MFRAYDDGGPDPYSVTAARLGLAHRGRSDPERSDSRARSRNCRSAFRGGHRAIQKMGKNFNMRIAKVIAEEWEVAPRTANPAIESFCSRP